MTGDGWEQRMAERAASRRKAAGLTFDGIPEIAIPAELRGELPEGQPDIARYWCTMCGLPDAPLGGWCEPNPPCLRCGSEWRWYGRLADRDGTATVPPDDGTCLLCYEWRRYYGGQEHFGWSWWRTCSWECGCAHHADEMWMA